MGLRPSLLALILGATLTAAAQSTPNIVLIMADDMGYSDIGCYGSEISTPNLDRLAAGGVRFTQFYNGARCCPTRASLLTGLYAHQTGIGWMMSNSGHDGYRGELNDSSVTIAQVLGGGGYATYMSGKWHLTRATNPDGPKEGWPRQRGFDRFFGTIHGAGSFFDPNSLTRENTMIAPESVNFYYTDAISENAVAYIEGHARREDDTPFFLYVAYTAPHWPMHALPEDIARYAGRYAAGWDALRAERLNRMVELDIVDKDWVLSERDQGIPPWEEAENRDWHQRRMEVYAAMVDRMDHGIGRIVTALEKGDVLDNTLILFLADNGGCAEEYGSGRPAAATEEAPPMSSGALQRRMRPTHTRDGRPVRSGIGVMPGAADTYVSYGKPWANASNTPFRLYKHYVHEGGIASPLIAHWPAGIERRGELETQPAHLIDVMATCVATAGVAYPDEHRGNKIQPMEGRSLLPAFAGEAIEREALYWEHEGNRAVRAGKWKLVARGEQSAWELYDLAADRSETRDLASAHPERVAGLAALWEAWARRARVYPLVPWQKRKDGVAEFSKHTRFELDSGADLGRTEAPFVQDRSLKLVVEITESGDGVLIAQGGSADGYALHVREGRLHLVARHRGRLAVVAADAPLPPAPITVTATLAKDGKVRLLLGDEEIASGTIEGPMTRMPVDGLQVGGDKNGAVGRYRAPAAFTGKIRRAVVTVGN